MKKTLSLVTIILLIISMLIFTGCGESKAWVESVLEISGDYSGHRTITLKYPLAVHIDDFADMLLQNNPLKDSEKSKFEYLGVKQDGYTFVMDIVFDSHEDYISQISTLIGRKAVSQLSQPDSVLCSGIRMKEDFGTADLVSWITKLAIENDETKDIAYDYSINTVSVGGEVYNTEPVIDICEREGKPINSIVVETTNLKDGTYDRTITFSVPNKTYVDLAGSIDQYFVNNTNDNAQFADWTNQGNSWEYKVIYKGLSVEELSEYTAMLLDTSGNELFYGDKDNSSTPLSEGLMFEESFNTFSFIGTDNKEVKLQYKYALPTKTTHGDGTLYSDGKWNAKGAWLEGVYSLDVGSDFMSIRIPDGIQYAINGIRMNLEVVDKNSFIRSTELLYSKTQGMDGMLYAQKFFNEKGVSVELDEDDENLICRVLSSGNQESITKELVKCFGSGNFMAYTVKDAALSLCEKTELVDYVDFSYMLNSTNANRPITYTVYSSGDENIIDLSCDTSDLVKATDKSDALTVEVKGGRGTVTYNGNIPDPKNIVVYCVVGSVMLCLTLVIIVLMLKKQKVKVTESTEVIDATLQQTTTFSISELKLRKDKIDKKYRDEIDKDIEEKIEANRIEALTREAKAKELEKLTRMVNGEPLEDIESENSDSTGEQNV
ncbi:MAG: hypothetical protein IJ015_05260 [Ruminococcus sp.]|nr:hypothetical protein [Ruminococcus sp.]